MVLLLILIIIALPFLSIAALQTYLDAKGSQRNKLFRCYRCNKKMLQPKTITHNRGNTYYYCNTCFSWEMKKSAAWLVLLLLVTAICLIPFALSNFDANPAEAYFIAAAALLLLLLAIVIFVRTIAKPAD